MIDERVRKKQVRGFFKALLRLQKLPYNTGVRGLSFSGHATYGLFYNSIGSNFIRTCSALFKVGNIRQRSRSDAFQRFACEKGLDRKSTRLNSSHIQKSRMPSSA